MKERQLQDVTRVKCGRGTRLPIRDSVCARAAIGIRMDYEPQRLKINDVFTPPNAKLLLITYSACSARPSPAM